MIFTETKLQGVYIIDLKKIEDDRGFFARAYCQKEFAEHGIELNWAQANLANSKERGTLRGLHYQKTPFAEAKLMRCIRGAIYDVIVDLRPDSPSYMQWLGVELTAENRRALFIPEGFAHGYLVLEDDSDTFYPTSQFYTPEAEAGVRWNDPAFGIEWPFTNDLIITEKDQSWPDYEPVE